MDENYPAWICSRCGDRYGKKKAGKTTTWHFGDICGWCGNRVVTTEPRDFGHPDAISQEEIDANPKGASMQGPRPVRTPPDEAA